MELRIGGPSRLLPAVVGTVLLISACTERNIDPAALLVTNETRASVLLHGELPGLPDLAEELGLEAELEEALRLWGRSWSEDGARGRWALRSAAYDVAVPVLMGAPEVHQRRVVDRTRQAARALTSVPRDVLPQELHREFLGALEGSVEAEDAWEAGRSVEAIRLALESADRIRELSPPVVADRLVRRLQARPLGEEEANGRGLDLRRAERLIRGAEDALHRGDYARAIRRAHYAEQLLLNGSL